MDILKKLEELEKFLLQIEENYNKIKGENLFLRKELKRVNSEIDILKEENRLLKIEVGRKDEERKLIREKVEDVIFKLNQLED